MLFYSTNNALFRLSVKLKCSCAYKQTQASHAINWSNGIWIGAYFTVMALCWINSLIMFTNESCWGLIYNQSLKTTCLSSWIYRSSAEVLRKDVRNFKAHKRNQSNQLRFKGFSLFFKGGHFCSLDWVPSLSKMAALGPLRDICNSKS